MSKTGKRTDEILVVSYENEKLTVIKLNEDFTGDVLNIVNGEEATDIYKNLKGEVK